MKKHSFITALSLLSILSSCSSSETSHPLEDYVRNLDGNGESFHVLQLTDIHWNMTTQVEKAAEYLNNTIKVAKEKAGGKIDLIAITGDTLLVATKAIAERVYEVIDSWNIPFFVTYGNHDLQGLWDKAWMNENVSYPKRKNSLFVNMEDNVHGESNYVINWQKDGKTIWQVYSVDTGHYLGNDAVKYGYDYIHEDQVEWFEKETDLAKGNKESYLPSIVFGHIGLPQMTIAADKAEKELQKADESGNPNGTGENGYIGGYYHEHNSPSKVNSSFFESAKTHGVKGMFVGHDHSNDAVFDYEDVLLGYGVKANTELYYSNVNYEGKEMTLTGAALYTLKQEGTFDIEHIYIDYNDWSNVKGWKKENL